ncbi:hypothetical protein MtrunA17_Chr4g0050001 [Medicago truncatula]|uniref:Uncharacterized protein n=1 Tax=Medicago truncatula TaxID=3880 RepID=A0A396IID9_MEDTR|nr:hypothetical protein MtrunA17_Chr4g0050001 [Medicago truncatula]
MYASFSPTIGVLQHPHPSAFRTNPSTANMLYHSSFSSQSATIDCYIGGTIHRLSKLSFSASFPPPHLLQPSSQHTHPP